MPRSLLLFAALALAACSKDALFLTSEGMSTLLLVTMVEDAAAVEAFDLTEGAVVLREPPAVGELYALGYAKTVDALGLQVGSLTVTPEGGPLPTPDRQHLLGNGAWSPLGVLPPEVANLRVTALDGCAAFDLYARTIAADDGEPTFAVPLDDTRVLVGTDLGHFRVHELERSYDVTELSTSTPNLAGFVHHGEVWLIGPGTRVMHGQLGRGFVEGPPLPFDAYRGTSLDGAPEDAPFELFATDGRQGVAHFDGERWRLVKEPVADNPNGTHPGIAWIEPGLAVLTGIDLDVVIEVSKTGAQRTVRFDLPLRPSRDSVWSAKFIEGRGAVIGSRANVVYTRRADGWEKLDEAPVTPRADAIIGLGRGAFVSGGNGVFGQWRGNDELCEVVAIPGGFDPLASARLGTGFAIVVDAFETRSIVTAARKY